MRSLAVILAVVCVATAVPQLYRSRRDIGAPPYYRPPSYQAAAPVADPQHYSAPVPPEYYTAAAAAPQYYYSAPAAPEYYTAAAAAAPRQILITKQSQNHNFNQPAGTFNYGFESENGIKLSANGYGRAIPPNETAQVIQGQYSYTAPDGSPIHTRYYADETGFHAEGAHLPTQAHLPSQEATEPYIENVPEPGYPTRQ